MSNRIPRIYRRVEQRLSFAAPHVDGFKGWLRDRGYHPPTIEELVRLLAGWIDWMSAAGFKLDSIPDGVRESILVVKDPKRLKRPGDISQASIGAANLFIRFLQDQGVLVKSGMQPTALETWPILEDFRNWMHKNRGLAETTLDFYQAIIVDFLRALGGDPTAFTAEAIRAFVLQRAAPHSGARARGVTTAIRAFLRFLVATGKCPTGRDYAIPGFANWKLVSVPKFLVAEDIERVISACNGKSWLRDRAVILLLARLGLRASDVANLKFSQIDWTNGRVAVCGKSRREEWLPLTQEVGDAILAYFEKARPPLSEPRLFITDIAPLRPLSRCAVKCIVTRALERAGVKSAAKGAHVLRHSAATAMLRHGVSLAGVGAVLRHRSVRMTMHYAKVDFDLLSEIAQPWPGRPSC